MSAEDFEDRALGDRSPPSSIDKVEHNEVRASAIRDRILDRGSGSDEILDESALAGGGGGGGGGGDDGSGVGIGGDGGLATMELGAMPLGTMTMESNLANAASTEPPPAEMNASKGPRSTLRLGREGSTRQQESDSSPGRAAAYAAISSDDASEDAGSAHAEQEISQQIGGGGRMRVESISDGEDSSAGRAESGALTPASDTLPGSDADAEEKKVDLSGRMAAAVVSGLNAEVSGSEEQEEHPDNAEAPTTMSEATASPSQVGASFFGEQSL